MCIDMIDLHSQVKSLLLHVPLAVHSDTVLSPTAEYPGGQCHWQVFPTGASVVISSQPVWYAGDR